MVMQLTGIPVVGGSNLNLPTLAPPPAAAALKVSGSGSDIGCVTIGPLAVLSAQCVPTAGSLLSKNF